MVTIYANPTLLNSLSSATSTSLKANVTTPNDANYAATLFYYRLFGSTQFISAGEGVATLNTTADFTISSLEDGKTYELYCVAVDVNDLQSVPSAIYSVTVGTVVDEEELYLDNLKEILSQCATFQSWTSSANKTEAKEFIFKRYDDSPSGKFAIINTTSQNDLTIDTSNSLSSATMSLLLFEGGVGDYSGRDSDAKLSSFATTTGKIRAELKQLQGLSSNLVIKDIDFNSPHSFGARSLSNNSLGMMVDYTIETGF